MKLQTAFIKQVVALLLVPLLVLPMVPSRGFGQAPPAPAGDQAWPREFQSGSTTFTVYQPQSESWKARDLSGRGCDIALNMQRYFKSVFPTVLTGARTRVGLPRSKTRDPSSKGSSREPPCRSTGGTKRRENLHPCGTTIA